MGRSYGNDRPTRGRHDHDQPYCGRNQECQTHDTGRQVYGQTAATGDSAGGPSDSDSDDEYTGRGRRQSRHRQFRRHRRTPSTSDSDSDHRSTSTDSHSSATRTRYHRSYSSNHYARLPPFTALESWRVYYNKFKDVAKLEGWTESEKLKQLLPRLQGKAAKFVFGQLPLSVWSNYRELVRELNHRFGKVDCSGTDNDDEIRGIGRPTVRSKTGGHGPHASGDKNGHHGSDPKHGPETSSTGETATMLALQARLEQLEEKLSQSRANTASVAPGLTPQGQGQVVCASAAGTAPAATGNNSAQTPVAPPGENPTQQSAPNVGTAPAAPGYNSAQTPVPVAPSGESWQTQVAPSNAETSVDTVICFETKEENLGNVGIACLDEGQERLKSLCCFDTGVSTPSVPTQLYISDQSDTCLATKQTEPVGEICRKSAENRAQTDSVFQDSLPSSKDCENRQVRVQNEHPSSGPAICVQKCVHVLLAVLAIISQLDPSTVEGSDRSAPSGQPCVGETASELSKSRVQASAWTEGCSPEDGRTRPKLDCSVIINWCINMWLHVVLQCPWLPLDRGYPMRIKCSSKAKNVEKGERKPEMDTLPQPKVKDRPGWVNSDPSHSSVYSSLCRLSTNSDLWSTLKWADPFTW